MHNTRNNTSTQRKKYALKISVSVLDGLPCSEILSTYTDAIQQCLAPSKVPWRLQGPSINSSVNLAMACFRALCRSTQYARGLHHGFEERSSAIFHLWPGIRAWSVYFISICKSQGRSESGGFDTTEIMIATTLCLRSLTNDLGSYYNTILTDHELLALLVELWRESCRSHCQIAVRNLTSMFSLILRHKGEHAVLRTLLEMDPAETAKLCIQSVFEDYEGPVQITSDDVLDGSCLHFMLRLCIIPVLARLLITEGSVRFLCTLLKRLASKVI
ncbi:hypothetical protein EDD18DRAFT_193657 [Armillaria luteobubalina]|uniref:Uncharacterized protein n=1 Tax=Armillaria luteobubalina TaxID=153913 RepID=A0AA39P175_9AGAR|nr:hypothetical protein EDD18DRAFT_193657 [Armillaria luteobubalina]